MKIWKWELQLTDQQTLQVPAWAQFLDVQMQGSVCCIWALCDEGASRTDRTIALYGTGTPMPDSPGEYIATFQVGEFVLHAFEIGR